MIKEVEKSEENSFVNVVGTFLLENMAIRSKKIMENDMLRACLNFDPRFQHKLKPNYVQSARNNNVELEATGELDILTEHLMPQDSDETENYSTYAKIENLKLNFQRSTICVLNYWKQRRFTDPELYILSNIIFGVPPTQVSVERAFSSLKIILTDSRNRLSQENLENILLAKLNSSLLDEAINELI
ncbi:hypothetical protein CVS40_8584 [Lucilia cuprina]|nr:hypothetical protein CVS40_8584 [Lucilia cuprina]